MDWDAIGAIGEIVGAAAVVLSLFYVGLQVRQNSTSVRGQTYESLSSSLIDITMRIAGDAVLSEALNLAVKESELSEDQERRIVAIFHSYTRVSAAAHYQYSLGLIGLEQLENLASSNRIYLRTPIGSRYWALTRSLFPSDFVTFMDNAIKELDASWLDKVQEVLK